MVLHVDRGDKLDQRELLRRLADLQYTRNDMDLPAPPSVRGDVIDISRPNPTWKRSASSCSMTRWRASPPSTR
jgi:excinuclease UvrABC helicase subunit UvrB